MGHIQEIELPDGTVVLARLTTPDVFGADDQDVGVLDAAAVRVEQLGELITAVGSSVLGAARAAGPDEAAVTFGVELTAKSGRALAVLAEGEAKASVQVTLTWHMDDRSPRSADRADNASGATVADDAPVVTPTPRAPADGAPYATPDDRTPGSASAHA
ncbi:hypothetical protein GCM10018793_40110 [Streptomyces sulfonofaciens]|uniref:Trypsin-co-occurring domain-containing protein n=1 Tax=Streptomyces sulfonofaciens TaxID=68272 RepID=A0A919L2T0_9ACTN|nr:CU044_2847 family protein [Streptomyces sulfonofaciens]GHH81823.1 hypothetical protein GCM10018793_40110 [Streptomyces sulfonofaciens]